MTGPIRLLPVFRERVWGREDLAPYFPEAPEPKRIGEVWFTCEENPTSTGRRLGELLTDQPEILGTAADPRYPGLCPLLVKLVFTAERLSVQVHPDDEYAQRRHRSLGKTEAWYVLDSQPPGELAVGFRETVTPERLRSSAQSGEIEHLLAWRKVQSEDVIFVPAGTVHAIGAGLTICEIQENSDLTYRLYDYGRRRELHLEDGANVARLGPCDSVPEPVTLTPWRDQLVACNYFRVERLRLTRPIRIQGELPSYVLLICAKGSGTIAGESFAPGEAWMIPAQNSELELDGPGSEWIVTYTADQPTSAFQERAKE